MPEIERHEPGTFCWVDLSTTDVDAAKTFYGRLFGWEGEHMPAGNGLVYTMFRKAGRYCSAVSAMSGEEAAGEPTPHWNSYVAVEDADVCAAEVAELGGTAIAAPFDVLDAGRMAVVRDPGGAALSLWQPRTHQGAAIVGEHGTLTWNELWTADPAAAAPFYTRLFGWRADTDDLASAPYVTFELGGRPASGMLPISRDWGPVPAHWAVYFAVDDCDAAAGAAKDLGAEVRMPPTDYPRVGRAAILADPQGAVFSIITSERA